MAEQNSFDVVSKVDMQEVKNAVDQALKEVSQRFDFKGTKTEQNLKDAFAGESMANRLERAAPGEKGSAGQSVARASL